MVLDLEKHLVAYGAYHHNPVNIWIHMIFVPVIMATSFQFGTHSREFISVPEFMQYKYLPFNAATIASIFYSFSYLLLEPVIGLGLVPLIIGTTAWLNYLTMTYGTTATMWSFVLWVVAWLAQFYGHGAHEKRSPTLVDNLFQALFLAPLFVFMEYTFLFGYRPKLQKRVEAGVAKKIAEFQNQKKK